MSDNDGLELAENGTAILEFSGVIRTIKRPTLGQYRAIIESLGDFRKIIEETKKNPDKVVDLSDQLDMLIGWLDGVLVELAGEGFPRIESTDENGAPVLIVDESKLAPWLLSATVVTDLITHWQTVPSRRGGQ